jgi:hypothetical protein
MAESKGHRGIRGQREYGPIARNQVPDRRGRAQSRVAWPSTWPGASALSGLSRCSLPWWPCTTRRSTCEATTARSSSPRPCACGWRPAASRRHISPRASPCRVAPARASAAASETNVYLLSDFAIRREAVVIEGWRRDDNGARLHLSLGDKTPAEVGVRRVHDIHHCESRRWSSWIMAAESASTLCLRSSETALRRIQRWAVTAREE